MHVVPESSSKIARTRYTHIILLSSSLPTLLSARLSRQSLPPSHRSHTRPKRFIEVVVITEVFRIYAQTLGQLESFSSGSLGKPFDMRPRLFRIDEVRSQRRNAAPIVNACAKEKWILVVGK